MLKMMKYEARKNRGIYLIMAGILLVLEAAYLLLVHSRLSMAAVVAVIMVIAGYVTMFMALGNGVAMFKRDLRDKTGYMVYMTPVPPSLIVLGKILVVFISGTVLFSAYMLLAFLDIRIFADVYSAQAPLSAASAYLSQIIKNLSGTDTLISLLHLLACILVVVFFILCTAYFSVALGNTVLRGKKGEKFLSFVICIALLVVFMRITSLISGDMSGFNMDFTDAGFRFSFSGHLYREILSYIFGIAAGTGMLFATSYLLENKIDL